MTNQATSSNSPPSASQQATSGGSTPTAASPGRASESGVKLGGYCILTKAEEYELWCKKIQTLLEYLGLWDDVLKQPMDTKETKLAMESNVSMDILANHMDCKVASEYWSALKDEFAGTTISHKVDFIKQMADFSFSDDVKADFIRAKALVRGLINANEGNKVIKIEDLMQMILIAVLPPHLAAIRAVVNADVQLNKWSDLESRCVQEDATNKDSSSKSLITRKHPGKCFGKKCYVCDPSLRPTCSKCRSANMEKYLHKEGSEFCKNQLANEHYSSNKKWFSTIKPFHTSIGTADSSMTCTGRGQVTVRTATDSLILNNVLHCPTLKENLLSVSRMCQDGYTLVFSGATAQCFKNFDKNLLPPPLWSATASKYDQLWRINLSDNQQLMLKQDGSARLSRCDSMHQKLGHLNQPDTIKVCNKHGISIDESECSECTVCMQAKSKKPSMKPLEKKSDKAGVRIHSDICGPLPLDLERNRYLLTFTDDYSRFTFAFLLKKRSDTFKYFQYVHNALKKDGVQVSASTFSDHTINEKDLVNSDTTVPIRFFRSDNAKEYLSSEFKDYMLVNGITHEPTVTYTPQQNGVSERKNLTIFNKVRAMLIQSQLPERFWGRAALTAVYLTNISPTSANADQCPFELFYGRTPSLDHLRTFGEHAFIHVPAEQRGKLDARAVEAVFVGYSESNGILYFYNFNERKVERTNGFIFPKTQVFGDRLILSDVSRNDSQNAGTSDQFEVELRPTSANDNLLATADSTTARSHPSESAHDHDDLTLDDDVGTNQVSSDQLVQIDVPEVPVIRAPHEISSRIDPCNIVAGKRVRKARVASHRCKALVTSHDRDPLSVAEALSGPNRQYWKEAMQREVKGLIERGTWSILKKNKGDRLIKCKWVFTTKTNSRGKVVKYKARLVAKGFSQVAGLDYQDTYAPTARTNSLRIMVSTCASKDYELDQVDVVQAFVIPDLKEELYMEIPEGDLLVCDQDSKLKLHKTLYGLKQAASEWYSHLSKCLAKIGFVPTASDPCFFHRESDDALILAHVDDMLLGIKGADAMKALKQQIKAMLDITDCGEAKFFLGLHLERNRKEKTVLMHQHQFIAELLDQCEMSFAKPSSIPMDPGLQLSKNDEPQTPTEKDQMEGVPYRETVGALLYAACATRPDISAAVGKVCKFSQNPGPKHWQAVKRILRYLKGSSNLGILLGGHHGTVIQGWSDADWAGDIDQRRSTGGYVFKLADSPVSWSSKLQNVVALSSCESEYIALANSAKEALWLRQLMKDINCEQDDATVINEDNQGSIAMVKGGNGHSRSKHIDVRHHFIRYCVKKGDLRIVYCPTEKMIADIMTKALPAQKFLELRDLLGMVQSNSFPNPRL
ncbi:hypothetical protein MP228_008959 [Amoeboaphelidium protococcarum]|nr:hypothetical protein MP228_008959 [Amoeboaphelidium protococcarum]